MSLSLASTNALSSTSASIFAFGDNLGSSSVSRFSPGKCSAKSSRSAQRSRSVPASPATGSAKQKLRRTCSPPRLGEKVAGLRRIADPGANGRRRHQGTHQQPRLGGACCELMSIFGSCQPRGRGCARDSANQVTSASCGICRNWRRTRVRQPPPAARQVRISLVAMAATQHGDLFLQRLQPGEVDGIILEIDDCWRKRRRPDDPMRSEIGEDSEHRRRYCAQVPGYRSVVNAAVPLGAILP